MAMQGCLVLNEIIPQATCNKIKDLVTRVPNKTEAGGDRESRERRARTRVPEVAKLTVPRPRP